MSIATLLADWRKAQGGIYQAASGQTLPALQPVKLTQQQQLLTAAHVAEIMPQLAEGEGWLMLPGERITLPASAATSATQLPLEAEARVGNESWQLRHLQGDQWLLVIFELEILKPDTTAHATHLAQAITHLADQKGMPDLTYQLLWQLDDNQAPQRSVALFTGFKEEYQ